MQRNKPSVGYCLQTIDPINSLAWINNGYYFVALALGMWLELLLLFLFVITGQGGGDWFVFCVKENNLLCNGANHIAKKLNTTYRKKIAKHSHYFWHKKSNNQI